jgi:DNA-binding transcriptional MocR family regulator
LSEQSLKSRWQQAITQNGTDPETGKKLGANAMQVAFYVSVRAKLDGTNDQPPRQKRIADELGIGLTSVERAIRELVKAGWLTKGRGHQVGQRGSEYVLTFPSPVKAPVDAPVADGRVEPSPVKATNREATLSDAGAHGETFMDDGNPSPVEASSLHPRGTNMSWNMSPNYDYDYDSGQDDEPEPDYGPLANLRRRAERAEKVNPNKAHWTSRRHRREAEEEPQDW